jgi:2-succinyl-5-enolpyruvyl-6-hydroxy-3-cyclohexene-1-carboxylate synthase
MPMDTYINLRAFVDELVRCGMRAAVTSPGSRNTPLLLSLARDDRLRAFSHIDERCAGFFALGFAKASGLPVGVTCTSGTATANLAPAVIEAYEARVPLIVLTADRPPELRDLGAGQTIDQIKLYGRAAKWFVEVDEHPASEERVRWMRQLACRAYWTAVGGRPGPVHLNVTLREPLVVDGPIPEPPPGRPGGRPWIDSHVEPPGGAQGATRGRTVVVAGRQERSDGAVLAAACAQAGVPLLADPLSGARRGAAAIAHYDAFLRAPWPHAPETVVRVGDLPTSKPLRRWLAGLEAEQVAVDPENAWQDPGQEVGAVVSSLPDLNRQDEEWLPAWREADARAREAIEAAVGEELSEPAVAALLAGELPPEATLLVASSMPVRDLETFAPVRDEPPRVLANRGANGIDGTVSAAYGIAAATRGPTVCLIGDVALLHDVGGLLSASRLGLEVTFVVLNNDGGGIFHFLAVAGEGAEFEKHVATPHGIDLARVAAAYGLDHALARSAAELREALARPGLVEVRTRRQANTRLHRAVWDAVARAR